VRRALLPFAFAFTPPPLVPSFPTTAKHDPHNNQGHDHDGQADVLEGHAHRRYFFRGGSSTSISAVAHTLSTSSPSAPQQSAKLMVVCPVS